MSWIGVNKRLRLYLLEMGIDEGIISGLIYIGQLLELSISHHFSGQIVFLRGTLFQTITVLFNRISRKNQKYLCVIGGAEGMPAKPHRQAREEQSSSAET